MQKSEQMDNPNAAKQRSTVEKVDTKETDHPAEKPDITTVDEYIAQFPPERQALLVRMRSLIRAAAPEAQERISWAMPTYWQGQNLVHFASGKNHIGFYPAPEAIEHFAQALKEYKTSKGAVQFPCHKPLPEELVTEMTRWRVERARKG